MEDLEGLAGYMSRLGRPGGQAVQTGGHEVISETFRVSRGITRVHASTLFDKASSESDGVLQVIELDPARASELKAFLRDVTGNSEMTSAALCMTLPAWT
jgi:hypothetical protein